MKAIICFFNEIKQEIISISWAKKEEIVCFLFLTVVVILCFSIFFCFIDLLFFYVIKTLLEVIHNV